MIDDCVDRNGGFAGAAVANDQFTLTAAERNHRVNHQKARRERPRDERTIDDRRRGLIDGRELGGNDCPAAIEWRAERINDAPQKRFANRHARDFAGSSDDAPRLDWARIAEQHRADGALAQIDREPPYPTFEYKQFIEPRARQAFYRRDAIADLDNPADLLQPRSERDVADLLAASTGPVAQFLDKSHHDASSSKRAS
ncbi:hypothetical protein LMG27198_41460 [Methylocystis echinoides]|uniref:Uncharacterized protein n=1 Tax=Methylocystis echinoides TaxID=29468 RepID=A0A9W6LU71_9HYPH|nr:hypothetical protein LMG27198_41460 [Methylocystis echinoides]